MLSGSVLFSGGDESVLVKWPVRDGGGKDKQDFLPRLGAPIQRIAIAQESGHVAIGCADNGRILGNNLNFEMILLVRLCVLLGVRVISSQSQVLQLLQGLVLGAWKPPVKLNSIMPAGLTCDYYGSMGQQTKNCLITNGRPGEVQFYSPSEDRQLFSVSLFLTLCF